MTDRQLDINKDRKQKLEKFMKAMPDIIKQIGAHMMEAYKSGAIDTKTKLALEQGATREEMLETIAVVTSMRGTTGVAESLWVIEMLDEMGCTR